MNKHKIAGWMMVAVLVGGGGVALAESAPSGPTVHHDTDVTEHDATTGPSTTAIHHDSDAPDSTEAPDTNGDNGHGAAVSAAAQDHSHDAECGNHGHYVSAIAHGETGCTTTTTGGANPSTTHGGSGSDHESSTGSDHESPTGESHDGGTTSTTAG